MQISERKVGSYALIENNYPHKSVTTYVETKAEAEEWISKVLGRRYRPVVHIDMFGMITFGAEVVN